MFKRASERYGRTPEPVTPYQRAAQDWDLRLGSARVQARNWRLIAFGNLLLGLGLAGLLAWAMARGGAIPYVVEVDRLGETRAIGPAIQAYEPKDAEIAWHLARFIGNVRSLSFDPVLVRQNWLAAYDVAVGPARRFLDEFARANDPFAKLGTRTVAVDVTSVVKAGPASYRVEWQERGFERGSLVETSQWTALLGVQLEAPRDEERLRKNPLGIGISDIAWSRDFIPESGARGAPGRHTSDPGHSIDPEEK